MRASRRPPSAAGRAKQGNRGQMERGGQVGQTGVVADEKACVHQHAGDREQVQTLQDCGGPGTSVHHARDRVPIRRPAQHDRAEAPVPEPLDESGDEGRIGTLVATAAPWMNSDDRRLSTRSRRREVRPAIGEHRVRYTQPTPVLPSGRHLAQRL